MSPALPRPLGGLPPVEIPLARAPLERVVVQVQFGPIAKIDDLQSSLVVAGFQEAIRLDYPHFETGSEQFLQIDFGPGGQVSTPKTRRVWRFLDAEKNWRISLTSEAIALEVKKYTSRADFLNRWTKILKAVETHFAPSLVIRVGMRYVNRIKDGDLEKVVDLIKPEHLGSLFVSFGPQVAHILSETMLSVEEGSLLLRFGKLPKGGTIDPNIMDPINGESFIIDIDVFSATQRKFDSSELSEVFEKFAGRAYSMFRHVVADKFDSVYGAKS